METEVLPTQILKSRILPLELKELKSNDALKKDFKEWKPQNCPRRLFKQYISSLGFTGT